MLRRPLALWPLLMLLLCGCSSSETEPTPPSPFEADPAGAWFAGDFHVHATGASNDTGGDSLPADIARIARERGLYFVVLTDHSNSTGSDTTTTDEDPALFNQGPEFPHWDEAADLSVPGEFLMIDGNEVSPVTVDEDAPRGHIGCVPMDLDSFDRSGAFVDRPRGDVTGGEVLDQAKARGCFAVINHPYGFVWMAYDWTNAGYDGIEVFNGSFGFEGTDQAAVDVWRCDLLQGKHVTPIGGSDNHRVHTEPPGVANHPALGFPTTAVWASEGSWPAIMTGLQAGHVAIYEGDSRLYFDGYDGSYARAEGTDVRILRMRGQLAAGVDATPIRVTRVTACDDTRPDHLNAPTVSEDVLLTRSVAAGETFDVELSIDGSPGVYTAALPVPGGRYVALSRAIVIE